MYVEHILEWNIFRDYAAVGEHIYSLGPQWFNLKIESFENVMTIY